MATRSIVELQRRLHETGRIRLGHQVPIESGEHRGKMRAAKLERFRFTSPSRRALDAVAELYRGEVRPWADAPAGTQWELFTEATELDVVVPPEEMGLSQSYELWSGGGCQRRCDGRFDEISQSECKCDPEKRDCKMTTRLSLMLARVPGIGLWRLETHSYYAGVELAGSFEMAQLLAAVVGRSVLPGQLRIEEKAIKRPKPRKPEETITYKFMVPVLDFAVDMAALAAGGSPIVAPGLDSGAGVPAPALGAGPVTAVPPDPGAPSLADQITNVGQEPKPRRGGRPAATLPPSGRRRGRDEIAGGEAPQKSGTTGEGTAPSAGVDEGASQPPPPASPRAAERKSETIIGQLASRMDELLRGVEPTIAEGYAATIVEEYGPAHERSQDDWHKIIAFLEEDLGGSAGAPEPETGSTPPGATPGGAPAEPLGEAPRWCQDLHVRAERLGLVTDQLHAIVAYVTSDRTQSTRDLKVREASQVNDVLTGYEANEISVQALEGGGWEVVFP